ncbi:AAL123Wp [Eremothecium gossypii ATCC 10895]|uniref:AAL123Wp n=1 Tax=Eremothecium gossypii (strain ATCC 10895 / CBS 109.51 / FGSC 9923 / NRRL Y-1056) TaxID=284811 RepID=Q75F51_EREGS|nr:AAL123Wp [Eremothecium gossypii ATCC 10895]AAS50243.1 AAL123Wp [Eremothecium gossypii ATCC 10895]AEY94528.1 FAAL123Wp [Eremothecium gossypii FDAG1]
MCPITVDVCLFDLDGTIVDTTDAVEAAWQKVGRAHQVDAAKIRRNSHGRRASETFKQYFPDADNDAAVKEFEHALVSQSHYVGLIPGANDLLLTLDRPSGCNPGEVFRDNRWAIVTSATPSLARSWFNTLLKKVKPPKVFITSADVAKGKPDPEGYQKAKDQLADILGLNKDKVRAVVFEDSALGIRAAKAMGAIAVGITSTYSKDVLYRSGADYVVEDLAQVCVMQNGPDGITLEITGSMEKGTSDAVFEEDEEDEAGDETNDDDDDDDDYNEDEYYDNSDGDHGKGR